jgi:GT2 family glycosyltransferase
MDSVLSIIIVTWNSAAYLPRCLASLEEQTFQDFEIIIVDNGSSDGFVDGVEEKYSKLDFRIEKLGENTGFTVANNIGARMAKGKWIALLNGDAFPEPEWLENLVKAAEAYPNACFSSRQIQANNPDFLDGEGDLYRAIGFAKRINYNIPVYPAGEDMAEIFSPCAAAALYPRQAFLDVGGFDEDFFSYYEDVDLGFRLRLHGLQAYYLPTAVVHHVGSASTGKMSDFSVYHAHRNLVWTYLKNMPSLLLWVMLPLHIFVSFLFMLTRHRNVILKAKRDALLVLNAVWKKRKYVQASRKASVWDIFYALDKRIFVRY